MSNATIKVTVNAVKQVAPTIRELTLKPIEKNLSVFSPGSHIVVQIPSEEKLIKNAYSLLSDPHDASQYKIAIRLQPNSRGGSSYLHHHLKEGDELIISSPSNLFAPEWRAKKHIFFAGGVGITPFMSYIPEMIRREASFEMHYLFRSTQTGAYVEELHSLMGSKLHTYDTAASKRPDIEQILNNQPQGTHVYICGPESLIDSIKTFGEDHGWASSQIHYEAFAAPEPGEPFDVTLKQSEKTIHVSGNDSLLEALEAADIGIPNLCRAGVCGQCITKVSNGDIEHRDHFLTDKQKARNQYIMPCVSRTKSKTLILDI